MNISQDLLTEVRAITTELIEKMHSSVEEMHVVGMEEMISIEIETTDSKILIGYRGETLAALQTIISLILSRTHGEYIPLTIDINGYRKRREASLENLTERAANEVKESKMAITLDPMNSHERRIVHLKVKEIEGVSSESEGEGKERHVVIIPE